MCWLEVVELFEGAMGELEKYKDTCVSEEMQNGFMLQIQEVWDNGFILVVVSMIYTCLIPM